MIVLSDDITGAAEIAAIGASYSLKTELLTTCKFESDKSQLQVVSADFRSKSREDFIREIDHLDFIPDFVKIDSACRGHISETIKRLGRNRHCLVIPQNPSMGRIVRGGNYYINGVPLNQTVFALDPEFPMTTSDVSSLGVTDASTEEEIREAVRKSPEDTIFFGAADLFRAVLELRIGVSQSPAHEDVHTSDSKIIIVSGTTVDHALDFEKMPDELFCSGKGEEEWLSRLKELYISDGRVFFGAGSSHMGAADSLDAIKNRISRVTVALCKIEKPNLLVIEGGATAGAILRDMNYYRFKLIGSYAPGIVRLRPLGAEFELILKPGSYEWPEKLINRVIK